jgi:ribokinase
VALIGVGARGENAILLAPGANSFLAAADVDVAGADVVLTNFEIPYPVALAAVRAARSANVPAIVTPAPAHALSADLLELDPLLVPNEHELTVMIGNDDPAAALAEVTRRTNGTVIVTQGAAGALLAQRERRERFDSPRPSADAVDTTGAGDAFVGALAAWLASGSSLHEAICAANAGGALSVAAPGARAGLSRRAEIEALLRDCDGAAAQDQAECDSFSWRCSRSMRAYMIGTAIAGFSFSSAVNSQATNSTHSVSSTAVMVAERG